MLNLLNVVALNGRLTADPDLRHTNNGIAVAKMTLAVERDFVKQGQERKADFIDIIGWRNTAEFMNRNFRKGQLVAVEGSIQVRSYTDNQGNKRRAFEVIANNVHFAESKRDSNSGSNRGNEGQSNAGASQPQVSAGNNDDFVEIGDDDDLPF